MAVFSELSDGIGASKPFEAGWRVASRPIREHGGFGGEHSFGRTWLWGYGRFIRVFLCVVARLWRRGDFVGPCQWALCWDGSRDGAKVEVTEREPSVSFGHASKLLELGVLFDGYQVGGSSRSGADVGRGWTPVGADVLGSAGGEMVTIADGKAKVVWARGARCLCALDDVAGRLCDAVHAWGEGWRLGGGDMVHRGCGSRHGCRP